MLVATHDIRVFKNYWEKTKLDGLSSFSPWGAHGLPKPRQAEPWSPGAMRWKRERKHLTRSASEATTSKWVYLEIGYIGIPPIRTISIYFYRKWGGWTVGFRGTDFFRLFQTNPNSMHDAILTLAAVLEDCETWWPTIGFGELSSLRRTRWSMMKRGLYCPL